MPLTKTMDILRDADRNGYCAAAFNVFNYETIHWAIQAAEDEKVPVIIQFYPGYSKHIPMSVVTAITRELAAGVRVPVGLHLDHSFTLDQIREGMNAGFLSVMIDGSNKPFRENIRLTRSVVEEACAQGVEVEAELGHVGSGSVMDDFKNSSHFTSPEASEEFIGETGADFLAISIGNAHGAYVASPMLDFDRLAAIHDRLSVPLVLHGGSDIPEEQLHRAIQLGICKTNIATEYNREFFKGLQERMHKNAAHDLYSCLFQTEEHAKAFIRNKIRALNPAGYQF